MQIVIDIPDEDYNVILANADLYKEKNWGAAEVWDAIVGGVPLPKGHGRLIDADKILYFRCSSNVLDCPKTYDFICQHCEYGVASKFRIDEMNTIIEADNSEED